MRRNTLTKKEEEELRRKKRQERILGRSKKVSSLQDTTYCDSPTNTVSTPVLSTPRDGFILNLNKDHLKVDLDLGEEETPKSSTEQKEFIDSNQQDEINQKMEKKMKIHKKLNAKVLNERKDSYNGMKWSEISSTESIPLIIEEEEKEKEKLSKKESEIIEKEDKDANIQMSDFNFIEF
eukprot:gene899-9810_t